MSEIESILSKLESELPAIISRSAVPKLTGGLVAAGTLANADSRGDGPAGMFYMGRRAVYPRAALLSWLRRRMRPGRKAEARGDAA